MLNSKIQSGVSKVHHFYGTNMHSTNNSNNKNKLCDLFTKVNRNQQKSSLA